MAVEQKIRLGVSVTAQSFGFFKNHKSLILFPVISLVLALIFIAAVAVGVFEVAVLTDVFAAGSEASQSGAPQQSIETDGPTDEKTKLLSIAGFIALFCLYVCISFVFNFFNVALAACVLAIFRGEPAGVMGSIAVAARRLTAVLGWSVIAAVVGSVANAVESRGPSFSSVLTILAGFAWRMATFFVIPIIASKPIGSVPAIKESVHLMRQVWGESVVANLGLRGVKLLIVLVICGCLALAHLTPGPQALMATAAVLTPLVLILILFLSTIGTIARAALFYYATEEAVPSQFDGDTLRNAITKKRFTA